MGQREDSAWEQFVQPLSQSIKDENCRPRSGSMLHHEDEKRISEVLYFQIIIPFFLSPIKSLRAWRKSTHYSSGSHLPLHFDIRAVVFMCTQSFIDPAQLRIKLMLNTIMSVMKYESFAYKEITKKKATLYSISFKLDIKWPVIQTYTFTHYLSWFCPLTVFWFHHFHSSFCFRSHSAETYI